MAFFKEKSIRDNEYILAMRSLPCAMTGQLEHSGMSIVPAHIRMGTDGGMGKKPSDCYVVPLSAEQHHKQHQVGEVTYWQGYEPLKLADKLWTLWQKRESVDDFIRLASWEVIIFSRGEA